MCTHAQVEGKTSSTPISGDMSRLLHEPFIVEAIRGEPHAYTSIIMII